MMPKFLKDILTNADGLTYCHARVSGFATTIVYWAMSIADFVQTHHFDYAQFAMGYGAILTAVCGGILLKKNTESS